MVVEEIRGKHGCENGNYDKFPMGMRVLSVDDYPTCLRVLETLLRKCQYHESMEFEFLIPEDARLRARISQRSNLKYVQRVLEHFDERQRHDFRESSLGFLADVPDIQFSAQLIQQLVFRGIRTDKSHELWFNVQGHYCRFGLQEYAVVTGLRCGVPPDDDRFHRVLQKTRLKDKYFRSLDKIFCAQIEKTLVRSSTPWADRYKLGLALIVEGVFNAQDNNVGIEFATLSIVDDLDVFFAYPWGRVGYSRLIKGFRGRYARKFRDAKRKCEKKISYTVHGFPIAMQIWAFEAIPEIGQRFGQRLGERSPRLLSWTATKQSQHRTYDAFFKKVQLHVFATLSPTELERNQHYMSTLVPFDDNVVPVLDDIARTVVDAQLDSDAEVSGGDGQDSSKQEDDGDETSRGSDDIASGAGDRVGQSAEENDDSSSDNSGDGDEGESPADRAQGGMIGAFSAAYVPHQDVFGDKAPSTSRQRGVQTGGGLTRSSLEDMLLDQRVLFEMLLQTVKLEIFEQVTAECTRLREFISTVVAPPVSTAFAAPNDMRNDPVHSPQPSRDSGKTLNQPGESVTIVDDKTKKKLDEIEPHGHDVGSSDRSSGKDRFKRSVEDDFDTAPSETANRVIHEDALHTLDAKRKGKLKDCRWDYEDYLMLCPNHNAVKLLRQQSKSRILGSEEKDYMPAQISYNSLKFWEKSPTGPKKWFFCGSALSSEETYLLANFASMCGATVSTCWKPKVTHVIAATNGKGACSRTSTFLLAILSGQWILTMDWVKGCIKENHPINEEPYEVKLDNHGCLNGPKNGRVRASTNAPKLFDGMKFFFSGDFVPAFKNELKYLVIFGGGAVYENLEEMLAFDSMEQKIGHRHKTRAIFFVYNHGSPQGSISEAASSSFRQILAKTEDNQSLVIPHTWLLETVAACNVPSLT